MASAKGPAAGRIHVGRRNLPGTNGRSLVAVGLGGTAQSADGGESWKMVDTVAYNSVAFASRNDGWAAGPRGRIAKWSPSTPGSDKAVALSFRFASRSIDYIMRAPRLLFVLLGLTGLWSCSRAAATTRPAREPDRRRRQPPRPQRRPSPARRPLDRDPDRLATASQNSVRFMSRKS